MTAVAFPARGTTPYDTLLKAYIDVRTPQYRASTFGIVDGPTDNSAALQALVDAVGAAGGGDIVFSPTSVGYYNRSTIYLRHRLVRLVGEDGAWFKVPLATDVAALPDGVVNCSANFTGVIGLGFQGSSSTPSENCAADFVVGLGGNGAGQDVNPTCITFQGSKRLLYANGYVANLGPGALAFAPFGSFVDGLRSSNCLGGLHVRGNTPTTNAAAATVSNTFFGNCQGAECYFIEDANDVQLANCTGSANVGAVAALRVRGSSYVELANVDVGGGGQSGSMGSLFEANGSGQKPVVSWVGGITEQADYGSVLTGFTDVTFVGVRHTLANLSGSKITGNSGTVRYVGSRFDNNSAASATPSPQQFDVQCLNSGPHVDALACTFASTRVTASTFNSVGADFNVLDCECQIPVRPWGTNVPRRIRGGKGYTGDIEPGGLLRLDGTGSPETVVAAPVGSTYRRTDGGVGTSFYVKETGTGNTGWAAK